MGKSKLAMLLILLSIILLSASVQAITAKKTTETRPFNCCESQIYKDYQQGLITQEEATEKIALIQNYTGKDCCQLASNITTCEACFESIKPPFEGDDVLTDSRSKLLKLRLGFDMEDFLQLTVILIPLLLAVVIADGISRTVRKKHFLSRKVRMIMVVLSILLFLFFLLSIIGFLRF